MLAGVPSPTEVALYCLSHPALDVFLVDPVDDRQVVKVREDVHRLIAAPAVDSRSRLAALR